MIIRDTGRGIAIDFEEEDTKQLKKVITLILPPILARFAAKNKEYQGAEEELGPRAQFVDINRKVRKVKTAIWDEHPELLTSEPIEEVLQDLAGHVFLTLSMLAKLPALKLDPNIHLMLNPERDAASIQSMRDPYAAHGEVE